MKQANWFSKIENMHPYRTLLYLGMIGSGIIFLFMAVAFIASQPATNIYASYPIPKPFVFSSLFLIASAYTSSKILPNFLNNRLSQTKHFLAGTFLLGITFSGLQIWGWRELSAIGVDFRGLPSGSFLYVLSGIHLIHLAGAMIYGLVLLIHIQKCENDPIKTLLLLADPYERMKLDLFAVYWKFMDLVWFLLFFLFLWMF